MSATETEETRLGRVGRVGVETALKWVAGGVLLIALAVVASRSLQRADGTVPATSESVAVDPSTAEVGGVAALPQDEREGQVVRAEAIKSRVAPDLNRYTPEQIERMARFELANRPNSGEKR